MTGVIVAIVVVVAVVAAVVLARVTRHPEQTASHTDMARDATDERFYSDSRPAGPDAEDPAGPTRADEI